MNISPSLEISKFDFNSFYELHKENLRKIPEINSYQVYDRSGNLVLNNIGQQICINRINYFLFLDAVCKSPESTKYIDYQFQDYLNFYGSPDYLGLIELCDIKECGSSTKKLDTEEKTYQSQEKIQKKIETNQTNYKKNVFGIIFAASLGFAGNAFYSPSQEEKNFKNQKNFETAIAMMANRIYKEGQFLSAETDMKKLLENEINSKLNLKGCDFFPDDCSQVKSNVHIIEERKKVTFAVTLQFGDHESRHFSFQIPNKKAF